MATFSLDRDYKIETVEDLQKVLTPSSHQTLYRVIDSGEYDFSLDDDKPLQWVMDAVCQNTK